jgi:hypothetical protein
MKVGLGNNMQYDYICPSFINLPMLGTIEGASEGGFEGIFEGEAEGSNDGVMEGAMDGREDGTVDGRVDGEPEGPRQKELLCLMETVIQNSHTNPLTHAGRPRRSI